MPELTTYYLQMHSPDELIPATVAPGLQVIEATTKQFAFNRFLYSLVGGSWQWTDQLQWSDEQWRDYAEADNLRTWVAYEGGSPAGYFELQRQQGNAVEIRYFGLAPPFIGRGFGGHLLTCALREAWQWNQPDRVWVHTCSRDHPSALANYQARGMHCYLTERDSA